MDSDLGDYILGALAVSVIIYLIGLGVVSL